MTDYGGHRLRVPSDQAAPLLLRISERLAEAPRHLAGSWTLEEVLIN